ncbi:MAG: hypothetical protein JK586_08090 [Nocardiopsis sp. BM-2018]|nr:MAG: hypothetical protein JK586_08090 [Nocardiopsis sp. BM-2018]
MRRLAAEHTPPRAGDFPGGARNATLGADRPVLLVGRTRVTCVDPLCGLRA